MRLIRLRIRNIASLKGEHEVDFLDIQKESPLFAITGETGSGKSSILNSIGLALYGQIYKKNVNQLDVVTLGEKEGSIELIIQVKGKYYLADWRAKVRKQNGELYSTPQTPSRNLYTIEGTDFTSPKNIAGISANELLNLDFDQFCKCIILNQGEFAKFLTSSFTDRKDILEKLYPGELLESMGRELKLELDTLQSSKNEIEIKLGELSNDNLSGEVLKQQKKELEAELSNLDQTLKNLEKLDYHFVSFFNYFDKFIENERKKEVIKKDMAIETTKYNHLLKTGEAISEKYQSALKTQETELPLLQTFLKKEETLKLLEEGWQNIQNKVTDLKTLETGLQEKLKLKNQEEKTWEERLGSYKFNLPLADLKSSRSHFESLFELFSEKELLQEELKGKSERLSHLEATGKEIKAHSDDIEKEIKLIPTDIKEIERSILQRKNELNTKIEQKQRATIQSQELKTQIEAGNKELILLQDKIAALKTLINKTSEEIFPLEATLKLQEVLLASQVCVDHAINNKTDQCPVCESKIPDSRWGDLKNKLAQTDLNSIRKKFDDGNKLIFQSSNEEEMLNKKALSDKELISKKEYDLKALEDLCSLKLPDQNELDQELEKVRKDSWKLESLIKEFEAKKVELNKTREQYVKLKVEMADREKMLTAKDQKLTAIEQELKTLIPVINKDTIRDLKLEVRNLNLYLETETSLNKVRQEKQYLTQEISRVSADAGTLKTEEESQIKKINEIRTELDTALKGEKASVLIQKINQLVKAATEEWNNQVEAQNKQKQILTDSQGRLYQLDELTKDYDLHFTNERHAVRALASQNTIPELKKLENLDLDFKSPRELYIPLKELISQEKEAYKEKTNQCRMNFAAVSTRLTEWEKLQDKIQLLELQAKDINDALQRKLRLFEVLGKDELRTFVLSLVEENLIHQTNDELQKLCQGRYEIVHQTKSMKMTPEFFILDKFREGGRRKVSTLSGGETFMVSLAMALGLAEMTRGQAEIDSLFIDEGFGTLDQDSLEDVLEMLNQIQTRGLMVGIISHIKTLTQAIPVNLVLNKKQDGTSTVSLQLN